MALITERYAAELQGVLTCYDRMIIQAINSDSDNKSGKKLKVSWGAYDEMNKMIRTSMASHR